MSSVTEIESAIRELPEGEFWKLATWFDELRADAWDRQIEADAGAGRLDFLFDEAARDLIEGNVRSWPELP